MMATYGKRMHDWENDRDEADWQRRMENAVDRKDYSYCEDLIEEGLMFGYDFPGITDQSVLQLIAEQKQKKRK